MQNEPAQTPKLLYLGIAVFLVLSALTAVSIQRVWRARSLDIRARALFDLVRGTVPNRPTDTPGASAWLYRELARYRARQGGGSMGDWPEDRSLPVAFQPYGSLLADPPEDLDAAVLVLLAIDDGADTARSSLYFRDQLYAGLGEHAFVITRRRALGGSDLTEPTPANAFLAAALPRLVAIREALAAEPASPVPHRIVRLYALSEDGTLATLPLGEPAREALLREGAELRKLPRLPNFVSNEFFFVFDFEASAQRPFFSGLYPDLGGQGLIGSITAPFPSEEGLDGVLGMDIAFTLSWADLAANLEPPLVAELVTLPHDAGSGSSA